MSQFNIEIAADYIAGITFLVAACVCFIQGLRKRNNGLAMLGVISLAFGTSVTLQAISYMIVLESFDTAMQLKQLSNTLSVLGYVFIFIFVNYVWFERMQLLLLVPVIVIATLEIAAVYFTEGLITYTFMDGGTVVATSIGKTGLLLVCEVILGNAGTNLIIVAYITYSYVKAPGTLKRPARFLMLFTWACVFVLAAIMLTVRTFPNSMLSLALYGINYLITVAIFVLLIVLAIRNPQLLCILPFRVDRLLVIYNNSGLPLFDHHFSKQKVDEVLFSGLIQGLQQMSIEVLQKGQIRQIILDSGVLTFQKMELYTVGLLASSSSQILAQSFSSFTSAFERQFHKELQQFNGDRSVFGKADLLIRKYFENIPQET